MNDRLLIIEMNEKRSATARILMTIRLDRVLKERAEAQAEAENRNLNNYIETTLMERLRFQKVKRKNNEPREEALT